MKKLKQHYKRYVSIFGAQKDSETRVIDSGRIKLLDSGFGKYSEVIEVLQRNTPTYDSVVGSRMESGGLLVTQINPITNQILDVIFSNGDKNTSPIERTIVEEITQFVGVSTRYAWKQVREARENTALWS